MTAPPSATDLTGRDLGGGWVALSWTHPDGDVEFDVYATADVTDPFRTLRWRGQDTTAEIGGLEGGVFFFTVVARRGDALALPSRLLRLALPPAVTPVTPAPSAGRATGPRGLAFPFEIGPSGRPRVSEGDRLLHEKIVQLLLTSPGERVNLPDYGTRLRDLVFDPANDILAATTEFTVGHALMRFLGDEIDVGSVRVSADGPELSVDLTYVRRADLRTERLRIGIPIPR